MIQSIDDIPQRNNSAGCGRLQRGECGEPAGQQSAPLPQGKRYSRKEVSGRLYRSSTNAFYYFPTFMCIFAPFLLRQTVSKGGGGLHHEIKVQ